MKACGCPVAIPITQLLSDITRILTQCGPVIPNAHWVRARRGHGWSRVSDKPWVQCYGAHLQAPVCDTVDFTEPLREGFYSLSVLNGETEALGAVASEVHLPLALRLKSKNMQQVGLARWVSRKSKVFRPLPPS